MNLKLIDSIVKRKVSNTEATFDMYYQEQFVYTHKLNYDGCKNEFTSIQWTISIVEQVLSELKIYGFKLTKSKMLDHICECLAILEQKEILDNEI